MIDDDDDENKTTKKKSSVRKNHICQFAIQYTIHFKLIYSYMIYILYIKCNKRQEKDKNTKNYGKVNE